MKDYKRVIALIFKQSEGLKDFCAQTLIQTIREAYNPTESEKRRTLTDEKAFPNRHIPIKTFIYH